MPPPSASARRDPGARWPGIADRAGRCLTLAILGALTVLFVEVLFESWVQELLGNRTVDEDGVPVGDLPGWPKALKNGLLLALVALSAAKITLERRWRDYRTRADLALIVLAIVMVVAGLLGTSGPTLIGEAVFVYLRGAIVFYAVRALQPTWKQVRRVLWVVCSILGVDVLIAVVQAFGGRSTHSGLGWVDMQWAETQRAHGLLDHPNHLGHLLGLVLIGLTAWMSASAWAGGPPRPGGGILGAGLPRITRWWWWIAFAAATVGLAATQSRESMLAVLAAAALIWFLRRSGGRTVVIAVVAVAAVFAVNQLVRPGNLDTLVFRIQGVFNATETVAGEEDCEGFETIKDCIDAGQAESREIRVLFYQQGARLLAHRPVLGYGVGQFGGIVAEQHDPNWEDDPRFPGGFNLYDFDGTTVDSFWLHLTVEVGVVGLLAYLAWLWFLTVPLLAVTRRYGGRRVFGAGGARDPAADERTQAVALWGIGAMLFTVLVGVFSPVLEDPLFPPLVFAVFGIGWVFTQDVRHAEQPRPGGAPGDALGSKVEHR